MNLYIPIFINVSDKTLGQIKRRFVVWRDRKLTKTQQDLVDVLVVNVSIKVGKSLLDQFPELKWVVTFSVGIDHIDTEECLKRGIEIINAKDSNSSSVAEHVIGLSWMLARRIKQQLKNIEQGKSRGDEFLGDEWKEKVVGLVGCGAVGQMVAKKFNQLGVKKVLGYDPYVVWGVLKRLNVFKVDLTTLLGNSDIVSIQVPLTPATKNLISAKEIKMMKPESVLINVGRGGVVNERDLIELLQKHQIVGAALDVWENEPKVNKEWLGLDNLVLTPHLGAFTKKARRRMEEVAIRELLRMVRKLDSDEVHREVGRWR